jgi:DNA-binding NarL/FixJ family response regulator
MTRIPLKHIIIVEDSPAERTMMTDFLSRYEGVKITGFYSGDACIKAMVTETVASPDLVLMDYFLDSNLAAKYDGLDTLVKIKEICPDSKVIMFTSVENNRIVDLAKEKGAFDYIVKNQAGFEKLDQVIRNAFLTHP